MNKEIILANFASRPVRTSVSILAVAIEVTLILVVIGLVTGIKVETGERTQGVGADLMLQPPNSGIFLGMNQSVMGIDFREPLLEMEGVAAVAPVVTQFDLADLGVIYGIEPESFEVISGGFNYLDGRMFEAPGEILIDDLYAAAKEIGVGDEVGILNHVFEVAGVVEHGKGARLFIDIREAQEMTGAPDMATLFYILCDPEADCDAVADRISGTPALAGYQVTKLEELVSLMINKSIPALDAFLTVVMGLAIAVGALVIFLSMYTTIAERTREIGILRSLGASKAFVVAMILREAFWLCIAGGVVGVTLSYATAEVVRIFYPTLEILILGDWIAWAMVLAILTGIGGASYPSLRAARQDPVEALAYE